MDGTPLPVGIYHRGDVYEFHYRDAGGKQRQGTANNVDAAVMLRAERMREAGRDRVLMAPQRRRWRANALRATMAAAALRQEQKLARTEKERDAVRREHERMLRLARKLPPEQAALGRAYEHVRKCLQNVERAEPTVDGVPKIRLLAAYQSLYEAQDSIMLAITNQTGARPPRAPRDDAGRFARAASRATMHA